ncbi:hypothetical protein V8G54_001540 [Vigna mungo]|uniref:Uncharacterized protein n=1 Tax=Vigna mungo TaxID=3915 RepID=A0AAQ3SBL6_VIGMU
MSLNFSFTCSSRMFSDRLGLILNLDVSVSTSSSLNTVGFLRITLGTLLFLSLPSTFSVRKGFFISNAGLLSSDLNLNPLTGTGRTKPRSSSFLDDFPPLEPSNGISSTSTTLPPFL